MPCPHPKGRSVMTITDNKRFTLIIAGAVALMGIALLAVNIISSQEPIALAFDLVKTVV